MSHCCGQVQGERCGKMLGVLDRLQHIRNTGATTVMLTPLTASGPGVCPTACALTWPPHLLLPLIICAILAGISFLGNFSLTATKVHRQKCIVSSQQPFVTLSLQGWGRASVHRSASFRQSHRWQLERMRWRLRASCGSWLLAYMQPGCQL